MSACSTHVYVTCVSRERSGHVAAPRSPNIYNPPTNSFSNTKNGKIRLAVVPKMSSNDNSYRAGEAKGQVQAKTEQALDAIKDKAEEAKEQAGVYYEGAKDTVLDTAQAAKEKVAGAAQATKEAAEAGKDKTGEFLLNTGDQIKGTAEGAAEAVKNAFAKDEK